MNKHSDGWSCDEVYRSMRNNSESYKKISMELLKLRLEFKTLQNELDYIKKENESLKKEVGGVTIGLKTWNDYILHARSQRNQYQHLQWNDDTWSLRHESPE